MKRLTLTNYAQGNTTVLENEFIDHHMVKANGEYVKVYLLLLRHMNEPSGMLSVSEIADKLECTEKDVVRALNYWKKQGLLDYCEECEELPASESAPASYMKNAASDAIAADSAPLPDVQDDSASAPNIQQYRSRKERKEFKELLFVAEQYLGKTLSSMDIDTITYFLIRCACRRS